MKIKSIARICAQDKRIFIYDKRQSDGEIDMQWIGDGSAMYPAFDLPLLEEESIFAIFDIPEKNRDKYLFQHKNVPERLSFEDQVLCENILDTGKLEIAVAGRILKPLQTQRGLAFIDAKYLSPLSDSLDTLELYEQLTPDGQVYIVAKAGFMVMAVIMPYDIINENFVKQMEELTRQCRFALSNKALKEQPEDEEQQTGLTDPG
jgi:hypothetical protein